MTKADMKISGKGRGFMALSYVNMFQNFIFRYYHKLNVKHVTASNEGGRGSVAAHGIFILILPFLSLHSHPCERSRR